MGTRLRSPAPKAPTRHAAYVMREGRGRGISARRRGRREASGPGAASARAASGFAAAAWQKPGRPRAIAQVVPRRGRVISLWGAERLEEERGPGGGGGRRLGCWGSARRAALVGCGEVGSGASWCRRQTPREAELVSPPPAALLSAQGGPLASARPRLPP